MSQPVKTAVQGAWASPVSAESLAESGIGVADLRVRDGRLYWLESRPAEGGRMVVMTTAAEGPEAVTPRDSNVRTRVHEYGGAAYLPTAAGVIYCNFRDQRLYRTGGGEPLTPEGFRYADFSPAGADLMAVREDHTDPADVRNSLVRLRGDGPGEVLWAGSDFVAYPRVSADGGKLAWMAWDHPNMPWDSTTLYMADLSESGLTNITAVAGGDGVSAMEPAWAADGSLVHVTDESGFWNLYSLRDGERRTLLPMAAEFAGPLWGLGQSNYALFDDGRLVACHAAETGDQLVVLEADGSVRPLPLPYTALRGLQAVDDSHIALVGAGAQTSSTILIVDIATGAFEALHQPSPVWLDERYVSTAQAISFPTAGGVPCHALYYPPRNDDFAAPAGEAPPLIVQAHGGPTGQASSAFSLSNQFWTSRGFAVVDVDYRGSAGYGRVYRQQLNGRWGITDVEDVIAAAQFLIASGRADPARIAIHGGSAGGFTVLAALTKSDVFKAGGDFYGVADLEALARDTHKFESRYLDNLVGPYPEAKAVYEERSPIHHLEGFRAPLLILQGADDPIVPPNQAYMIRDALRERQAQVALIEFAGEGHGFRRAENIIAAKQAELYFYGRVFGFTPADDLPAIEIDNLPLP